MNIGQRLRELREAKGPSKYDIEKRTSFLQGYVSRVECGHAPPNLVRLEKWAKALDLELYQLFYESEGVPVAPKIARPTPLHPEESALLEIFQQMPEEDKHLFLGLARVALKNRKNRE